MDNRTAPTHSIARRIGVRGVALGLLVLAPAMVACSTGGDRTAASDDTTAVVQDDATATSARDQSGVTSLVPVDGTSSEKSGAVSDGAVDGPENTTPDDTSPGQGSSGGGSGANPPSSVPQPVAVAPVITSFETPDDIDCHNGNFQEFTARWTTTGATKVTISIDGPGVYAEYPVSGETSLPFTCPSAHTFLLTAYGSDGQTATTTVTLQSRNAQVAEADQAGDES